MPWPSSFSLDPRKVVHYLLDESHVEGGAKARFFLRFGFSPATPFDLASVLLAHPTWNTFVNRTVSDRGDTKLVFEGPIVAPDGRTPRIRSVWRMDENGTARFVTAVPVTR
jgi:hypothetical protein